VTRWNFEQLQCLDQGPNRESLELTTAEARTSWRFFSGRSSRRFGWS